MKRKINLNQKLTLNKEKLNQLQDEQLANYLGGRMAAATSYTAGPGTCSDKSTSCCSSGQSSCCG